MQTQAEPKLAKQMDAIYLQTAQDIVQDSKGADYYADTEILGDFLSGRFELSKPQGRSLAAVILADRHGAGYYYFDSNILASFLEAQVATYRRQQE